MGTLRDTAYEELDYLSQLTEVVISPLSEILNQLPDTMQLTYEQINQRKTISWLNSTGFVLAIPNFLLSSGLGNQPLRMSSVEAIAACFQFEVSEDCGIDFDTGILTGTVTLVKVKKSFEEEELIRQGLNEATTIINSSYLGSTELFSRTVTVLNLLEEGAGTKWASGIPVRKFRPYLSLAAITDILSRVITNQEWRVRDMALLSKMAQWISNYLSADTELAQLGLMNLLKMHIMKKKDLPIYSIDEVKVMPKHDPT